MQNTFGVSGLGVMGKSLALNMERQGIPIVAYNYTYDLTDKLIKNEGKNKNIQGARTVYEFISALERPRQIVMMVTAGAAVDSVIKTLLPHLQPGDVLIDGGNSHFKDTDRRLEELQGTGIEYIGMGISGGEQGALWGPSMMPGGDEGTYHYLEPVLTQIAARVNDQEPCVCYIGKKSAGHFVKMVHNGIEYGDMQLIAEAYDLLRFGLGLTPDEVADTFNEWNQSELKSFLIEITAQIANFPDDRNRTDILLDKIQDQAGMKGTGTWTGQAALDLAEPIPTIIAALHARALSSLTEERTCAQQAYNNDILAIPGDKKEWINKIRAAVYTSKICSYAQGFALLSRASLEYGYGLKLDDIASIWRGGCIIRAAFLDKIKSAFAQNPQLPNLLVDQNFVQEITPRVSDWRDVCAAGSKAGIPLPAITASLSYFEAMRRKMLPANLIQAQRDFFGAHTYKRLDINGSFHTNWETK